MKCPDCNKIEEGIYSEIKHSKICSDSKIKTLSKEELLMLLKEFVTKLFKSKENSLTTNQY